MGAKGERNGTKLRQERTAHILADAAVLGDQLTAKRWGITPRTVQNYKRLLGKNEALTDLYRKKLAVYEKQWGDEGLRFLRRAIAKLDELIAQAGVEHIHQVAGAIKIVGDLGNARELLNGGQRDGAPEPGEEVPPTAGGGGGSSSAKVPKAGINGNGADHPVH